MDKRLEILHDVLFSLVNDPDGDLPPLEDILCTNFKDYNLDDVNEVITEEIVSLRKQLVEGYGDHLSIHIGRGMGITINGMKPDAPWDFGIDVTHSIIKTDNLSVNGVKISRIEFSSNIYDNDFPDIVKLVTEKGTKMYSLIRGFYDDEVSSTIYYKPLL